MSRLVVSFLVVLCVVDMGAFALDCLKCQSTDPQSECRRGSRKNKPKIDRCYKEGARCYALGVVHLNGTTLFERGCSSEANFCEFQNNAEFCTTCGFNYCNYVVMQFQDDVEQFLQQDEAGVLEKRPAEVNEKFEDGKDNNVVLRRNKLFRTLINREEDNVNEDEN